MGKYTLGRVPEHEEPDTVLIGADSTFFARVVGRPGHPAEPLAATMAESLNVQAETGRTPRQLADILAAVRRIVADWNCWEDDPRGAAFALREGVLAALDGKHAAIAEAEAATP